MKVVVTGGAGFIGSHVVEELLKFHYHVVVIDNLDTGTRSNLPDEVEFYEMDLNDPSLEGVFEKEMPDYVIHLAAQASVTKSMHDPYSDFVTNTVGSVKLLFLSEKHNVRKLVFASSAAVYGEPAYYPIDEQHVTHPLSFYSLSKKSAENYIEFCTKNKGSNYSILRFSNVYGPRQNPDGEAGVISIFINRLVEDGSVNIFDGSQTRDFIYVKDVAVACRLAMESDHTGVLNISSNTETTINDLYSMIAQMVGTNKLPLYMPRRAEDITKSVLDNRRALKALEWCLASPLLVGLEETVKYYTTIFKDELNDINKEKSL